jgi:hypothetical protein
MGEAQGAISIASRHAPLATEHGESRGAAAYRTFSKETRGPAPQDFQACIRQRPFGIAGDRQLLPFLVRAPQRGLGNRNSARQDW